MLETINCLKATCDHCGWIESIKDRKELLERGWEEFNNKIWCEDCSMMFNDLKDELEEEGCVICLINDDSRRLIKDDVYQITELIFISSYSDDNAKKNLAIYVDTDNGMQARLNKGEYLLA